MTARSHRSTFRAPGFSIDSRTHQLEITFPAEPVYLAADPARLEQVSKGSIRLNMGTLYPALMRLEQRGMLRGAWGTTDTNRRARFYSLTPAGRAALTSERRSWERMVAIIQALMKSEA